MLSFIGTAVALLAAAQYACVRSKSVLCLSMAQCEGGQHPRVCVKPRLFDPKNRLFSQF